MELKQSTTKYRIILETFCTQADAKKGLKKIEQSVKNPRIEYSRSSGAWLVILYDTTSRTLIDKGYDYYKRLGINCYIQIYF